MLKLDKFSLKDEKLPLVSIITIVYNNKDMIQSTIRSVLNQSYKHVEYIIIDGGSTDGTTKAISAFSIDRVISERDRGISHAFNKGIGYANGELIGMINAGDTYELDAVQNMVEKYLATEKKRNDLCVYFGNICLTTQKGKRKIYPPKKIETFDYQMPIWHPTVFVTKNVYNEFGYNEEFKIAMDYDFFSKLYAQNANFIYVDKVISTMNTDGLSNSNAIKGFKEVKMASERNLATPLIKSYFYYQYRCILFKVVKFLKRR